MIDKSPEWWVTECHRFFPGFNENTSFPKRKTLLNDFIELCVRKSSDNGKLVLTRQSNQKVLSNLESASKIIKIKPLSLQYFSDNVKDNKDIVMKAIKTNNRVFEFASDRLKNDREVVDAALSRSYGLALQYASEELRNDKKLVTWSLRLSNGETFQYVGDTLKRDTEFIEKLACKYSKVLQVRDDCRSNRNVIRKAALRDLNNLKYASDDIKTDEVFLLEVIRECL
jgi:hypothetical protein